MRKVLLSISVFVLAAIIPVSIVHAEPRTAQINFEQVKLEQIRLEQVRLEQSAFDAIFVALNANTVRSADTPEWSAALKISRQAATHSCVGQQASAIVYSLIGWANRAVSGWNGVQACDASLVMPGLRERSKRQLRWYLAKARSGDLTKPAAVVTLNTAPKPLRLLQK